MEFIDGLIFHEHMQCEFIPANTFICILNELMQERSFEEILISSSHKDAFFLFKKITRVKKPPIAKIREFLKIINSLGVGKISLRKFENKKISLNIDNCVLDSLYRSLYACAPKKCLELFLIGFVKNFLSFLLGNDVDFTLQKKGRVLFVEMEVTNRVSLVPSFENWYELPKKQTQKNQTVKKVLMSKHVVVKEGTISFWNSFSCLLPYIFLIELVSVLDEERYKSFFLALGSMQGFAAVNFQRKYFGIAEEKLFCGLIEQAELLGIGTVTFAESNPLRVTFQVNLFSHFLRFYSYGDFKLLFLYSIGLFKGIYEFSYGCNTCFDADACGNVVFKKIKEKRILTDKEKELYKVLNAKALLKNI